MLHVLTVAFRERLTVSAVVASTYHTAKSANVIFPFVASMKYSVKSARYIYKSYYFYTLHTDFTNWIINLHVAIVTRCLVCVLQNCEKRRTVRRTALNNVVSETSLPVTQFDTSFETLVNTRQHTIQDIVQEALRQHGY